MSHIQGGSVSTTLNETTVLSIYTHILKPGKPPNEINSYRSISLLPLLSKLFKKKYFIDCCEEKCIIPDH